MLSVSNEAELNTAPKSASNLHSAQTQGEIYIYKPPILTLCVHEYHTHERRWETRTHRKKNCVCVYHNFTPKLAFFLSYFDHCPRILSAHRVLTSGWFWQIGVGLCCFCRTMLLADGSWFCDWLESTSFYRSSMLLWLHLKTSKSQSPWGPSADRNSINAPNLSKPPTCPDLGANISLEHREQLKIIHLACEDG